MATNPKPEHESAEMPDQELGSRLVFSLLKSAARTARWFELPLKELTGQTQLAYFRDLRQAGLTLRETTDALQVGMRKASELSQRLKENFFAPEREIALPRRIEFMLWAEPLSRTRIKQLLRDVSADDVDAAIATLLDERRISDVDGRPGFLTVTSTQARLVKPTWMSQIDGINTLMRVVAAAAHERVMRQSPRALIRTLNFRIAEEDIGELRELYESVIFPKLASLEERAAGREDAISMDLSILWCPKDEPEEDAS